MLQLKTFINYVQSRNISLSNLSNKIVPNNLKGKSKSSQEWLERQLNDEYVMKSRYHGYRCRSAFKLLEMDEKFKLLKRGYSVVDCGAAPGSWTQVVVNKLKLDKNIEENQRVKGIAIAVDLKRMESIKGAIMVQESDFTLSSVQEKISNILPSGKANIVLSDMAPRATGTYELDCAAMMTLVYSAARFSFHVLHKDGTFLCKLWDGNEVEKLITILKNYFSLVKRCKPKASRSDSSELYILAAGFKGWQK
ncbi:rRNA methyltransferase 2, mitochondrial [Nephila pilipes]|uniref:rRNA methyltransferase 2, mitochondrial n=1 Tax=Nephila pilipes TaxID=299642 RepID=A0A8X6PK83_NEPPI|nr:rRNA methyltransferase 2, mitochondrial [Nephila pilipes]